MKSLIEDKRKSKAHSSKFEKAHPTDEFIVVTQNCGLAAVVRQ